MAELNENTGQAKDMLNFEQAEVKRFPPMLNVLTILTYIGCGLYFISAIYAYFTIGGSYRMMQHYNTATEGLNSAQNKLVQSMMSGSVEMMKRQYDNRLMIMILALVGVALCAYGAMQMRKLKKTGYLIYVVGELVPIVSYAVFVGFGGLFGGITMIFAILIAAAFIILYTTQRKELVN